MRRHCSTILLIANDSTDTKYKIMCADSADTDQIVGGLVSNVGKNSVDQGFVPLKLMLYCVTEKMLSDFKPSFHFHYFRG